MDCHCVVGEGPDVRLSRWLSTVVYAPTCVAAARASLLLPPVGVRVVPLAARLRALLVVSLVPLLALLLGLDAKYVSIVSRLGSDTLYLIVSRVGVLYLTNNFEPPPATCMPTRCAPLAVHAPCAASLRGALGLPFG